MLDFFRTAAEALANQDTRGFLDQFDRSMPGYGQLRDDVEALQSSDVTSTLEVAKDEGNEQARVMELDWMLRIDQARPRRQIVKCRIEKQGKKWKITAFEPLDSSRNKSTPPSASAKLLAPWRKPGNSMELRLSPPSRAGAKSTAL